MCLGVWRRPVPHRPGWSPLDLVPSRPPPAEVGTPPPVRDTLAWLLTAVLGERMVIRETPDGGGRMGSFMRRFPELGHQPDIVLEGFDGPVSILPTRTRR